ncbi:MAG: TRAP transporter large permease subunit [Syntrophaceae bacterium]|nr:TRAP transporter large permease subunit [Syntrophaceae bacterium]
MLEMNIGLATFLMFFILLIFLTTGLPVVFVLGGVTVIFTVLLWGPSGFNIIVARTFASMQGFVLLAIGLFVLMAKILSKSGLAEKLYEVMHMWLCPIKGGLAIGTIVICAIFAAMCGISGAATVTLGLIAIPAMTKYNYNLRLTLGSVMGGGALGILIPPSAPMIIFGLLGNVSVGKLFAAGILPGLLLSVIFSLYVYIRAAINPKLAPPVPKGERYTLKEKLKASKDLLMPALLVFGVLGSIFGGVATPGEAAAVGAFGSLLCVAINKRLSWEMLKEVSYETLGLTVMIMWIMMAASAFSGLYNGIDAPDMINEIISGLEINRWLIIVLMQLILMLLGCFLEPTSIMFITVPIFIPIIELLGFDPIWFGAIFTMNMEMSYLTPPIGFNLFYIRGIVSDDVPMMDIYRSAIPFVILQLLGLILVMAFPKIALYLPHLIFGHPM